MKASNKNGLNKTRTVGNDGHNTLKGSSANDTMIGGAGADDFYLSKGQDVITDFDWREGDQIVLPEGTDLSKLEIKENTDDVIVRAEGKFRTVVENANLTDVIAALDDKELENALDNSIPEETELSQTIINTGLIKGVINLPTESLANVMIFDADGEKLTEGRDDDFTVSGRKINFKNDERGYYKIGAEFDWNNPDESKRQNYLTWMRDVIQFGDKDGENGPDPIKASSAFRLYMGNKISAIDDLKIDGSTSTYQMFDAAARFDGDLSDLDLSGVTDMYAMFRHAARFNNGGSPGINKWNTENVTRMRDAFWNALSFDQPVGEWDIGSVEDEGENGGMHRMFKNTPRFDQKLPWESSKLSPDLQTSFNTNLLGDKAGQKARYPQYNEELPSFTGENKYEKDQYVLKTRNIRSKRWDYLWVDGDKDKGFEIKLPITQLTDDGLSIDEVVDNNNKNLTDDISFEGSTVTIPRTGASQYTIKVSNGIWDNSEGAATNFRDANKLKWLDDVPQFADNGDVGNIKSGIAAFAGYGGDSISDLNNLDVSNISSTRRMFSQARKFNQNLGEDFVEDNITDSFAMFDEANSFNNGGSESIGEWDTSSITYMRSMFRRATAFNQEVLENWADKVSNVRDQGENGGMQDMFLNTPLYEENLSSWEIEGLKAGKNISFNTKAMGGDYVVKSDEDRRAQGEWPLFEANNSSEDPDPGTAVFEIKLRDNQPAKTSFSLPTKQDKEDLTFRLIGRDGKPIELPPDLEDGDWVSFKKIEDRPTLTFDPGKNEFKQIRSLEIDNFEWDNRTQRADKTDRASLAWASGIESVGEMIDADNAFYEFAGKEINNDVLEYIKDQTFPSYKAMFTGAGRFNQKLPTGFVDSFVKDFAQMFHLASAFNNGGEPMDWDVSGGKRMSQMFWGAHALSADVHGDAIREWDISNLEDGFTGDGVVGAGFDDNAVQAMFKDTWAFKGEEADLSDWCSDKIKNADEGENGMYFNSNRTKKGEPQIQEKKYYPQFGESNCDGGDGTGGGDGGGNNGGGGDGGGDGGLDGAPGNGNNGGNSGNGNGNNGGNSGGNGSIDGQPINPPVDPDRPNANENALRSIDVKPSPKKSAFDLIERGSQKPDKITGDSSVDKLTGKDQADILRGKGGDDYLFGDRHADTLRGGKGADVVQGGDGQDDLAGGGGKDILYGGPGKDVLTGNGGKDVFVLSAGKDVINDFKVGKDDIGLVYALDLTVKQKGDDLRIKGNDGVNTLLLNVEKDDFLADYPDNLKLTPAVEVNLI